MSKTMSDLNNTQQKCTNFIVDIINTACRSNSKNSILTPTLRCRIALDGLVNIGGELNTADKRDTFFELVNKLLEFVSITIGSQFVNKQGELSAYINGYQPSEYDVDIFINNCTKYKHCMYDYKSVVNQIICLVD